MSATMYQDGYYYSMDDYMEQEEEWEREGLLDPAWEKQQKKVSEQPPVHPVSSWLSNRMRNFAIGFLQTLQKF